MQKFIRKLPKLIRKLRFVTANSNPAVFQIQVQIIIQIGQLKKM